MAFTTTAGTIIDRTRRYLRDRPGFDTITASLSSNATSVTVADTTLYQKRWPIEIDYETMVIRSIDTATSMTVSRGAFGSTQATHANGAEVLIRPAFYTQEIFDALNEAMMQTWPFFYVNVLDTSLTTTDSTYEYTIPNAPGTFSGQTVEIQNIHKVELKYSGDLTYRASYRWWLVRAANGSGVLKFRSAEPGGAVIRISGYAPFTSFTSTSSVLPPDFPPRGEFILHKLCASNLLMSGEAGRARYDAGSVDAREEAMRPGTSMNIGLRLQQMAFNELSKNAMPPMRKHSKTVI